MLKKFQSIIEYRLDKLKEFKMFIFLWCFGMLSFAMLFLYLGIKKPNRK